ncbi:MAG: XrtA-associated tyrosine autokinase [bacterium]|nr:XrtA-associated tyrosine autokinase [bacterium]
MSKIEDALAKAKTNRPDNWTWGQSSAEPAIPNYTRSVFKAVDPALAEENRIVTLSGKKAQVAEQYRMLRTQILMKTEGEGDNCLMVTSSVAGEGKTTTAINLAIAIAQEVHKTVLLVDADLRSPSIHKYLGLAPEKGLVHNLLEYVPLEDILVRTGVEKLSFLPAGGSLPNSTEILRSPQMQHLILEVKERYRDRYVIFDTTPLLATADAMVLSHFMDGVVMVVQAEKTPRGDLAQSLEQLAGCNILGVVMNNLSVMEKPYYYYKPYDNDTGGSGSK